MSDLKNIEGAVGDATRFVHETWQQSYIGLVPGISPVKTNINNRKAAAKSLVIGTQISIPDAGRFMGSVIATKQIAVDLELGKAPWDMKPMLLGGPNAKPLKGGKGKYNTIPFRHGTPKSYHFSGAMPRDIYKRALGLKRGQKLTGTEKAHPPRINPASNYKHRNGIFEGMKRAEKQYEKKSEGQYITMRRVSSNSPDGAWWHPGYEAHNLVGQVIDYCRPGVEKIIHDAAVMDIVDIKQVSVGLHVTVQ